MAKGDYILSSGSNSTQLSDNILQGLLPNSQSKLAKSHLDNIHYPIQSYIYFGTIKARRNDGSISNPNIQIKTNSDLDIFDKNVILDNEMAMLIDKLNDSIAITRLMHLNYFSRCSRKIPN